MEDKLKKAKQAYDRDIPTSFTTTDKQAILEKITTNSKVKQERRVSFIPKTLTFVGVVALILFFVNNIPSPFYGTTSNDSANGGAESAVYDSAGNAENGEGIADKDADEGGEDINWGEDVKMETFQTTIMLSPELESIYKQYAAEHNDMILQNTNPLDVFKMYFHAKSQEDFDTVYALHIKGDKYGTPSEEEYFGDPEFWGGTYTENEQKLYDSLLTVDEFKVVYLSEAEAVVTWINEEKNELAFRLIKDTTNNQRDNGIWKVAWVPMQ
ncbi:hypothetical protein RZN25_15720 [Bacillaceae bacterium S4-13-56]